MKVYGQLEKAQIENVTALPTAGAKGKIVYNTTDSKLYIDNGTDFKEITIADLAQTLTNKTIVVASNTVTTTATGNLVATELNAALAELQTDIDTRATSVAMTSGDATVAADAATALSNHEADTSTHGVTGAVVGTTDTQTLTNKTLTSPTLTTPVLDVAHMTDQGSTPATPSAGLTKFYAKTDGKLYKITSAGVEQEVGAGAGGGSINYISSNPDAEASTTGWTTFADGATLTDGTGGSPTATFGRQSGTILRGTNSFQFTAGTLGDGVNYNFTVPNADKAKVVSISFDYAYSGTVSTEGAYQVYIYDGTNGTLIQPTGYKLPTGVAGTYYKHQATFQTSSTGTSYRLIIWQSITTPGGNLFLDNVEVGPQSRVYGAPVTDWESFTPSWNLTTAVSVNVGKRRRVGDTEEIKCTLTFNGANTQGAGVLTLPRTIDTAKMATTTAGAPLGMAKLYNPAGSALGYVSGRVYYNGSNTIFIGVMDEAAASTHYESTFGTSAPHPWTIQTGSSIELDFSYPVTGWSSSTEMSSTADTRVVAATYGSTGALTIPNATQTRVIWNSTATGGDTHAAMNTSTGVYTCPVAGWYRVSALTTYQSYAWTAAAANIIMIKKNTTTMSYAEDSPAASVTDYMICQIADQFYCNAGDTISVWLEHLRGADTLMISSATQNKVCIERITGPAQIAASESISARYSTNVAQSLAGDGSYTIIDFEDREWDTHGAVTTGASWKYTAQAPGKYRITAALCLASGGGWAVGEGLILIAYKNGVRYQDLSIHYMEAAHTTYVAASGSTLMSMNAGDYFDIRLYQVSGAAIALNPQTFQNSVCVERIGL